MGIVHLYIPHRRGNPLHKRVLCMRAVARLYAGRFPGHTPSAKSPNSDPVTDRMWCCVMSLCGITGTIVVAGSIASFFLDFAAPKITSWPNLLDARGSFEPKGEEYPAKAEGPEVAHVEAAGVVVYGCGGRGFHLLRHAITRVSTLGRYQSVKCDPSRGSPSAGSC